MHEGEGEQERTREGRGRKNDGERRFPPPTHGNPSVFLPTSIDITSAQTRHNASLSSNSVSVSFAFKACSKDGQLFMKAQLFGQLPEYPITHVPK